MKLKKRNTTIKYNREIWTYTIQTMDKLSKIRKDRVDKFFERHMKSVAHDEKDMIKSDLIKHE